MDMKLNAILKEEAKSKITEVKRATFYGKTQTETRIDLYIGRTQVTVRQGVVQSELPIEGPISEEITDFIVAVRAEVMIHEDILGITRAKGKYTLPDDTETTGTVELYMKGTVNISCYGPTREKTLELYELIRNGNIRPSDEWDKAQIVGGPDRLEQTLELLRSATADQARLTRELEETREALKLSDATFRTHQQNFNNACEKNVRVRRLADDFKREHPFGNWMFGVSQRINIILDDTK